MKKIIIVLILIIIAVIGIYLLIKPNSKTEEIFIKHDMVLQQVEELGQLEVVKYNIRDVIEYKKLRKWLPNSKTALIVVGEVVACVDLTKIEKEDIVVIGDSVSIMLPVPEVCHFKVDHSRSRVYDMQYGLWESSTLVDEAYREAEQQLYKQAWEMGIATESRQSAVKILTPLMHALGFKKVRIDFQRDPSQQPLEQDRINILPPVQN